MLPAIIEDVRFGARALARTPGWTALVIAALALGIGANTAMFSVVDALLIHPLRYDRPEQLAIVFDQDALGQLRGTSAGNFLDWRKARSFSGLAGWAPNSYVLSGLAQPVQVQGARVTANVFEVLGVRPVLGRTFLKGEDGLDGGSTVSRVVVVSYGLWQDALGGDPNVLGRTIRLNDTPYAVIGVMPPGFELLNRRHQVWVPAVLNAANRDYRDLIVLGRLRGSQAEAVAEMQALSQALAEAFPGSNHGWRAHVEMLEDWLVDRRIRTRLLLLMAAVGFVLLLACSNVASLLLARSVNRSRELAVRVALGATRGRIASQLLVESLMLSLAGGLVGLALAAALVQAAPGFVPPSAIRTTAPLQLNAPVLAFTALVSILTGFVFGLAPALAASRPDVREVLQDASRGATGGRGRQLFHQAMVILEVAVALALLSGAGLMARSLERLAQTDFGVDPHNVLTQRIFLPTARYGPEASLRFYRQVLEAVAALPGVEQVAAGSNLPLARLSMEVPFDLEDAPVREMADMPGAGYITVSPGYFRLLHIPVLAGREFEAADREDAPAVAIVNAAFAARYFPRGDAVGQRLRLYRPVLGSDDFGPLEFVQIVGVVGNVTLDEIGAPPMPLLYAPLAQNLWSPTHWLAVRTAADPASIAAAVRRVIVELDPNQPLDPSSSLDASLAAHFAEPRFQSGLMRVFALLALVLAVTGIYGLNSYAVTQRRREIGVRMALGATPGNILGKVVGHGMRLTAVGILPGLAGAFGLHSVLASALVDVGSFEWGPVLEAAVLLVAVAALAAYLPARRATRIHPAAILRND